MKVEKIDYLYFSVINFRYLAKPDDPEIFKIENRTRLPVKKEASGGKTVFLHNDVQPFFEEGKKYVCAGKVTWRGSNFPFEIFIPEKVFVEKEGGTFEEIIVPDNFKNKYIIGNENERNYSELEQAISQNCCSVE